MEIKSFEFQVNEKLLEACTAFMGAISGHLLTVSPEFNDLAADHKIHSILTVATQLMMSPASFGDEEIPAQVVVAAVGMAVGIKTAELSDLEAYALFDLLSNFIAKGRGMTLGFRKNFDTMGSC